MECLHGVVLVRGGVSSPISLRMKVGVAGEVCLTIKSRGLTERAREV